MLNFMNTDNEGSQETKKKEFLQIFKEDIKPKLDKRQDILNRYRALEQAYNDKKKKIEMTGENGGFLQAAKLNRELKQIQNELSVVAEKILDADNDYLLDDKMKKQIESQYNEELSNAQREVRMYHDAIEGEFEKVSELYEKMLESQRKVVMARRLYKFMQKTAINDDFEQWPNGKEYEYHYREAMNWGVDEYTDHNLKDMPDTTIHGYKNKLEQIVAEKKLKIHQKYYRGF